MKDSELNKLRDNKAQLIANCETCHHWMRVGLTDDWAVCDGLQNATALNFIAFQTVVSSPQVETHKRFGCVLWYSKLDYEKDDKNE